MSADETRTTESVHEGHLGADRAERALARIVEAIGGTERPGQVEMVRRAAVALSKGAHLVVQAGTGTGKSLGYLVPAVESGRRVVVATATKQLQSQLAEHELPLLQRHGERSFTWSVLKGRSNYLCRQRLDELLDTPQLDLDVARPLPRSLLRAVEAWVADSPTGERDDLTVDVTDRQWADLSVSAQECPGAARCPRGEDCCAERARQRAAAADVCVVNTHLYGLHLATGRALLADHDVVIVDEAHELVDIISSTASVELSAGRLRSAARQVREVIADDDLDRRFDRVAAAIDEVLEPLRSSRLRRTPAEVMAVMGEADSVVSNALEIAESLAGGILGDGDPDGDIGSDSGGERGTDAVATRLARVRNQLGALREDLRCMMERNHTNNHTTDHTDDTTPGDDRVGAQAAEVVTFVEGQRDAPRLVDAPLDVGEWLTTMLWDPPGGLDVAGDPPAVPSVVLCSATIPPGLTEQLAIPPDSVTEADVGTPFDFATHALLYCAAHLPGPKNPSHEAASHAELASLIDAAGGRALVLCTSYRSLESTAERLTELVDLPVLRQGDDARNRLVARFRDEEETVLVATMGFWQGLDVPGPSLSLLTIDRLPFPRPDDPLHQARRERAGPQGFARHDLPRAATRLAQGVGRLIRTETDRGVVAVLDPRLATAKSYRWELIQALPPMRRTRDGDLARAYLTALRHDPDASIPDGAQTGGAGQ